MTGAGRVSRSRPPGPMSGGVAIGPSSGPELPRRSTICLLVNSFPASRPRCQTRTPPYQDLRLDAGNRERLYAMEIVSESRQEVAAGDALYDRGEFAAARGHFEAMLAANPADALVHFKVGACHWREGRKHSAYAAFQAAVSLKPDLARAHEWLGQWHLREGMGEAAVSHSLKAVALAPHDASALTSHAFVLEAAGDLDAAWALVRNLVREGYTPPRALALYGRLAPQRRIVREALDLVERLVCGTVRPADRRSLHFTAAELCDRLGHYPRSFAHAREANRLARPGWDAARFAEEVEQLVAYFTPDRFRSLPRSENPSTLPVLVVGMPRSGTSLVEQIVASHPLAHGAGELDFLHGIRLGVVSMLEAREDRYPRCLDDLTVPQASGLAEVYLEPLKATAPPDTLRITDKMPLNFMHLGLAALLLPGARVIHCRRNPMDTCLSCYMTHFTVGHEFSSDLADLGAFHKAYSRLMSHWVRTLPLPVHEVDYEALVRNPRKQIAAILRFLELPWDRGCLHFHEKRRFVTTASVVQVRRPMYRTSVGRWENYRHFLGPLERALR